MIQRLNIGLLILLGAILVLLLVLRVDNSRPNFQVNLGDDMTYSPAYTSFEPNDNFANGRTSQDPVPGTIARGTQLFSFEATPEGAVRAGEELSNPFDPGSEAAIASADRGATLFSVYCIACHGVDGTGNGPVAKRGFPPPPSLLIGKSREMKDGQLFHILTYGQNSMPQFAPQLPPASRWDLINYIRRIQNESPPAPTDSSANTDRSVKEETSPATSTNTETQP